jgi:hypothetical protein
MSMPRSPIDQLSPVRAGWLLLFVVLVAACSPGQQAEEDARSDSVSAEPTDSGTTPASPPQIDIPQAGPLPPTRLLPVTVEGQTEQRLARLFESPQGYAIYVLEHITMTQEEPCCDLAFAQVDGEYFMRIERIPADADLATLREDAVLALSGVGEAQEIPPGHAYAANFQAAELHLVAESREVVMEILVGQVGDGRYRVTLHLPLREPSEGIVPTLWAMLGSLQTTGPLRRP